MNRVLLGVATFISTILLTNSGFASDSRSPKIDFVNTTNLKANWAPGGGTLEIDFYNDTKYACKIKKSTLTYGVWYERPPNSDEIIAKHTNVSWWAHQSSGHGPDISMEIECGGYSFKIRNHQNFTVLEGGDQFCSVYDVDKHLTVTNKQTQHSSYIDDDEGVAKVAVSLKGSHFEFE